jgi:hypothetical protein
VVNLGEMMDIEESVWRLFMYALILLGSVAVLAVIAFICLDASDRRQCRNSHHQVVVVVVDKTSDWYCAELPK